MDFTVVDRPEVLVAGAVLRSPSLSIEGPRRVKAEQVYQRFADRVEPGRHASAFVDYAGDINAYLTHVIGYQCNDLDEVLPGDIVSRIPAGRYALFRDSGDNLGDVLVGIWRAIWETDAAGRLPRAYTGDYALFPGGKVVEVFVGLAASEK